MWIYHIIYILLLLHLSPTLHHRHPTSHLESLVFQNSLRFVSSLPIRQLHKGYVVCWIYVCAWTKKKTWSAAAKLQQNMPPFVFSMRQQWILMQSYKNRKPNFACLVGKTYPRSIKRVKVVVCTFFCCFLQMLVEVWIYADLAWTNTKRGEQLKKINRPVWLQKSQNLNHWALLWSLIRVRMVLFASSFSRTCDGTVV